ncbi:MAG: hypothetical protein M3150_04540 [Pseudomonadota bacterium]|nr:hypothetical protein [Pseudomonadota bacterium]
MFNLFKRSPPPPERPGAQNPRRVSPKAVTAATAAVELPELALPEVQEGNEQTDWALWEDSVLVMDSQLQGLTPSSRIYERLKEPPSEYQDIDPFSSISKNSP